MSNPFDAIDARLSNIETLLHEIKQTPKDRAKEANTDELLTVQDAAKFLSLSVPTVYGLISKGDIPVMKRSKRCYFLRADLIDYLKKGRKMSNSEIEAIAEKHIAGKAK
jgi:excisionase family DNA binding protein